MRSSLLITLGIVSSGALFATHDAVAGCCRVLKVDSETPPVHVRVCEASPGGECGGLLFEGTLDLGDEAPVCAVGATVVYEEYDSDVGAFGPPISARCDGGDVEL